MGIRKNKASAKPAKDTPGNSGRKRSGRRTTILARIIRLSSIATAITAALLIVMNQLLLYTHINEAAVNEIELLSLSYASAVSNADIYSNAGFLDGLFSDFRESNRYGGTGFVFSNDCKILSDTHWDVLSKGDELTEKAKEDPQYTEIAEFMRDVRPRYETSIQVDGIKKNSRYMSRVVSIQGSRYYACWSVVKNYDNIFVMILIPYDSVMAQYRSSMVVLPLISIGAVIAATICAVLIARRISKPIEDASKRMEELARGDLTSPAPETGRNDETKLLLDSLSLVITSMNAYISDIRQVLDSIAQGDLLITPQADYRGDFVSIKESLDRIRSSLTNTFSEVQKAAISVNECSGHVSDGTSALSKNASGEA
ncbi:MAG: methyl-accepting chemotaxis protein, partial [Oscillospiraceae bacterium]|nr:methyl-accepting chemotaxis protein [Oscillospiraceae bacterium]